MATLLKFVVGCITVMLVSGCYTAYETITICGKRYDVYKDTEYDYEQKLTSTVKIICFRRSRAIAFAYQSAGYRNNDSNLVYTILSHQNDSLVVSTYYNEKIYGDVQAHHRYFKCIPDGLVSLNSNNHITQKTAKRKNNKLKR